MRETPPCIAVARRAFPPDVRRALVLGASRSGIAAALALADLGVEVTLSDRRGQEDLPGIDAALRAGVRLVTEKSLAGQWPGPDLVVKSPGVPGEAAAVMRAREGGVAGMERAGAGLRRTAQPIRRHHGDQRQDDDHRLAWASVRDGRPPRARAGQYRCGRDLRGRRARARRGSWWWRCPASSWKTSIGSGPRSACS